MVKNPPAMQETWVRSMGWEDPLEKEMATHCNILTWRIPWMEEPGGLQSTWSQTVGLSDLTFHMDIATVMAPEKNNPRTLPPLPLDLANLAPWCYKTM